MATIENIITGGEYDLIEVGSNPAAGAGTPAPLGSLAVVQDVGGSTSSLWQKTGLADTAWTQFVTSVANGVTSVALAAPSIFTVSGSPVTTTGTLTFSLNTQTANTIFAGPASGAAAIPTFRTQVLADLPQLTNGQLYIGSTGASVVAAALTAGAGISITNAAGSITIANTNPKIKSGTVAAGSFAGSPKKVTITFGTAFASTAYAIVITGADNRNWTWESKAVGSFVINASANTALTGNVDWIAIATGEST